MIRNLIFSFFDRIGETASLILVCTFLIIMIIIRLIPLFTSNKKFISLKKCEEKLKENPKYRVIDFRDPNNITTPIAGAIIIHPIDIEKEFAKITDYEEEFVIYSDNKKEMERLYNQYHFLFKNMKILKVK